MIRDLAAQINDAIGGQVDQERALELLHRLPDDMTAYDAMAQMSELIFQLLDQSTQDAQVV